MYEPGGNQGTDWYGQVKIRRFYACQKGHKKRLTIVKLDQGKIGMLLDHCKTHRIEKFDAVLPVPVNENA